MTADDDRSAFEYFQRIEASFLLLRGAPLLLSPSDYRVAKRWFEAGVPLDLVLRTMDEYFERRRERARHDDADEPSKVWGLRQVRPAVDAAWNQLRELTAPGERESPDTAPPLDVAERVRALGERLEAALAETLPENEAERERLMAWLAAQGGKSDPRQAEEGLAEVEDAVLDALLAALGPAERRELETEVDRAIAPLADRMTRAEAEAARERLLRQKVRRRAGLPTLSLFAEL